jgi:hypothetical protein
MSFPRSGHEAVYHIAKRYFKDAFVYCDANNKAHCGCETVPCVNPARTFAKNHDFGVKTSPGVQIIPSEHYFIQYRNPVRAIVSNYHLHLKNHPDECERADWVSFAFRGVFYWNRFIDKWVLDFPEDAARPLYCTYESLIAEPEARMKEILTFMSDGPLDDEAAQRILEKLPITPRNSLAAFKFYDPVLFKELEDAASERLAELDLPSFKDEL